MMAIKFNVHFIALLSSTAIRHSYSPKSIKNMYPVGDYSFNEPFSDWDDIYNTLHDN